MSDETARHGLDEGIALALRAEDSGDWKAVVDWLALHPEFAGSLARFVGGGRELVTKLSPAQPIQPGAEINGIELIEELGRGAMGVVYRGHDRVLKRDVAVKMVRGENALSAVELTRLQAEGEVVASLDHSNIVPVLSSGQANGVPYLVMPLMFGGSLARQIKERGTRYSPEECAKLVREIALGVQHAHARGLIHRDLKPANVLLDEQGIPRIADFGLARRVDATATASISGTFAYMAPEQAQGRQLTTAVDIHAMGAILFELLTGRVPYNGDFASVLRKLADPHEQAPSVSSLRPDAPADLEAICEKCLARDPGRRYQSANELADDLERFLRREAVLARPRGLRSAVAEAIQLPAVVQPYVTLPAVAFGMLHHPLVQLVIAILVIAGAPAGWSFGVMMYSLVAWLGQVWWFHIRRLRELNRGERMALTMHLAMWFAVVLLLPLSVTFFGLNVMPFYPILNTVGGMMFFLTGATFAGRHYLLALAVLAQNALLPFVPMWTWPLIHAGLWIVIFGLFGLHLRQVQRASQQVTS